MEQIQKAVNSVMAAQREEKSAAQSPTPTTPCQGGHCGGEDESPVKETFESGAEEIANKAASCKDAIEDAEDKASDAAASASDSIAESSPAKKICAKDDKADDSCGARSNCCT